MMFVYCDISKIKTAQAGSRKRLRLRFMTACH